MRPKVSICIPTHDIPEREFLLKQALDSIRSQSFQDYEIVITKTGKGMAANTNAAIKQAKGDIIKILFMDDWFSHKDALKDMVQAFKGGWLIAGSSNNKKPYYTGDIHTGNNKLGSPSALMFENSDPLLFDTDMTWLLDCDLYKRLYVRYGEPTVLEGNHVSIGIGAHQETNKIPDSVKKSEGIYIRKKYDRN